MRQVFRLLPQFPVVSDHFTSATYLFIGHMYNGAITVLSSTETSPVNHGDINSERRNGQTRRARWPRGLKARVCGGTLAGIAVSNPAGCMDVCLLCVLCVVR
jgi:hypothetical protein